VTPKPFFETYPHHPLPVQIDHRHHLTIAKQIKIKKCQFSGAIIMQNIQLYFNHLFFDENMKNELSLGMGFPFLVLESDELSMSALVGSC